MDNMEEKYFKTCITMKNGKATISEDVAEELLNIDSLIDELTSRKDAIRKQILNRMIEKHIEKSVTNAGLTFTQVIPSKVIYFDTDSFITNESEDVVKCFTNFEEEKTLDIERFKQECPELYEKYCNTNIKTNVDIKKMQEVLPIVYNKYAIEKDSEKPISLRITKKRGLK